tara:strand:+ start:231 stop:494 length:264 start_codon:yes stop_codon:yes gene_type:complete
MIDEEDTTYLLMHGEMDSTYDIMQAVEQELEHRFHNYRILIREIENLRAEVKRLRAFIDKLYAKDPNFVDFVWEEGDPQRYDWGEEE